MLNTYWLALAPGVVAVGGVAYKTYIGIKRRAKHELLQDLQSAFVVDLAFNHMPHIYNALELICKHLGVELGEPPPIKYLPRELLDKEGRN